MDIGTPLSKCGVLFRDTQNHQNENICQQNLVHIPAVCGWKCCPIVRRDWKTHQHMVHFCSLPRASYCLSQWEFKIFQEQWKKPHLYAFIIFWFWSECPGDWDSEYRKALHLCNSDFFPPDPLAVGNLWKYCSRDEMLYLGWDFTPVSLKSWERELNKNQNPILEGHKQW